MVVAAEEASVPLTIVENESWLPKDKSPVGASTRIAWEVMAAFMDCQIISATVFETGRPYQKQKKHHMEHLSIQLIAYQNL
jgi:hypothetical protein